MPCQTLERQPLQILAVTFESRKETHVIPWVILWVDDGSQFAMFEGERYSCVNFLDKAIWPLAERGEETITE